MRPKEWSGCRCVISTASICSGLMPEAARLSISRPMRFAEHGRGAAHAGVDQIERVAGVHRDGVEVHRDMVERQAVELLQPQHLLRRSVGKQAVIGMVDVAVPQGRAFQGADAEAMPASVLRAENGCAHSEFLPCAAPALASGCTLRNTVLRSHASTRGGAAPHGGKPWPTPASSASPSRARCRANPTIPRCR